jgi:hypothetical protein
MQKLSIQDVQSIAITNSLSPDYAKNQTLGEGGDRDSSNRLPPICEASSPEPRRDPNSPALNSVQPMSLAKQHQQLNGAGNQSIGNSIDQEEYHIKEGDMKSSLLSYEQQKPPEKKTLRLSHVLSPVGGQINGEPKSKDRKASMLLTHKHKSLVLPPHMTEQEFRKDIMRAQDGEFEPRDNASHSKKSDVSRRRPAFQH